MDGVNADGVDAVLDELSKTRTSKQEHSADTTEFQLADMFSIKYSKCLRYVAKWGKWMIWDGKVWSEENTLAVFDLVRGIISLLNDRKSHEKAAVVSAVEKLARADRRHAATIDQWDADPWLLNTQSGIVDLRTGNIRPHDPLAYCTKITACEVGDIIHSECPIWMAFLNRVFDGNTDLINYVRRVIGYSLTGLTIEHQLWFFYGLGRNGKGVFLNTITGMLGEYAKVGAMETFTASPFDRHPTDLAMLRGARFVTAQETEEGRQWAEARIKTLTGGDKITARFMRQDYFEFMPQFKLLLAGNHKPGLKNIDEAMKARFNLVPFVVTIPVAERDPRLPEKLAAEWGGIMRWAIDGCLEWQKIGIKRPKAVIDATSSYIDAEDSFTQWLSECAIRKNNSFELFASLFNSWSGWATRNGEKPGSAKKFSQSMVARGFQPGKKNGGMRIFEGIELTQDNDNAEYR